MISINARKTLPDTISEASFSYLSEKTWTGSFSKRRGSTPASVAASGKRERRAKRRRERARVKGKKNDTEREAEGWRERSREDESKERRDELGLILPPQSGAASDSICFKYMDRGVWAQDARWLEGMPREKEKGSRYNTPYPTQGPPRPTRTYDKERRRERIAGSGGQKQDEKRAPRYTTQLVSSVFPSFGSQYPTPLPSSPPNLPNESALLRPTSSILPAARYRLPNNLTDCAPTTSGIRVLVSFQNLSEYPAILT